MWIMVGLDQWIAINGREAQQWPGSPPKTEIGCLSTRGLSGCVGLALSWDSGQIALAHVFSACTDGTGKPKGPNTWDGPNGYRAKLDHALAETQKAILNANQQSRYGVLVFSESKPTRTVELLQGWLTDNGIKSHQIPNWSSCDVMAAPEEDEDMDVSQAKQHIDYLITPADNGLTWGRGGQMIACEALSAMAHAADPPQGGT
ncbi:hypothetical protein [Lysobacter capsici]|jgi:hypothetical protein|uniref:hypothetical protein n=1 Tax=Lysobacter capsici TaxID=435897 RepID=UPI000627FCC6|nr:hypothetical protein [Lysobacter capsici]